MNSRYGAVDVHYPTGGGACAALVVASERRFGVIVAERVAWLDSIEPYQPGNFFVRELPAIQGYWLWARGLICSLWTDTSIWIPLVRPGWVRGCMAALGIPVVGVAKRPSAVPHTPYRCIAAAL